jgi:hypothetical protein
MMRFEAQQLLQKDAEEGAGQVSEEQAESQQELEPNSDQIREG